MAMKRIRYPDKLGKPTPKRLALAAMLRARGDDKAYKQWLSELRAGLLQELLGHYNIQPDTPNAWYRLALRLACDHVPAFTPSEGRGPGRPKKLIPIASLLRIGKRGAPRKWTDTWHKGLLHTVRSIAEQKGYRGRGAISRALADFIRDGAKRLHLSPETEVRRELSHLRKRYSEAKKKFPEIALK